LIGQLDILEWVKAGDQSMGQITRDIGQAMLMAFGMFWDVGWSLVLGFLISAILQVFVSKEKMSALLVLLCYLSPISYATVVYNDLPKKLLKNRSA
jgi:uncharacterized membrane protein YraQ (UPF0718 family)